MAIPDGYVKGLFSDPAEDHIGPFYMQFDGTQVSTLMEITPRHRNSMGSLNGGVLLAFADFTFSEIGRHGGDAREHCVTVTLDAQFIDGSQHEPVLFGSGRTIRRTGSLVFVHGELFVTGDAGPRTVLTFHAVGKRVRDR